MLSHRRPPARSWAIVAVRRASTPATLVRYAIVPRLSSIGLPSGRRPRRSRALGYQFEAGFAAADEIVKMSFKTAPVHQAYIEPQGCVLAR